MHFLDLTLGIRFEPVLGVLSRLKEISPDTSMPMVRSNENNIIYSNSMNTNRNELIGRLLSGVTDDKLRNLVRVREEARRPIPALRKLGVMQLIRYILILNLLLITKDEKKHVLIKDFNRMMFNKTKHANKKHFCMYCLPNFTTEQILLKHKDNCMVVNGKQAMRIPKEGENIVQFKNHHRQMPAPFVIYADFEAIIEKIHGYEPNNSKSYTDKYQKHTSCGYGYKVVMMINIQNR